jgi:hypothetical protein
MMLADGRGMQTLNAVQPEPATAAPRKEASPVIEVDAEPNRDEEETRDKYDLCYLACTD